MPRFFIDTDDGDTRVIDDTGYELLDAETARYMALDALPDMAREKLPDGDHRSFGVTVRNDKRQIIYVATFALMGGWKTVGR